MASVALARPRHRKTLGFDAFNAHPERQLVAASKARGKKRKRSQLVDCKEIEEPKTGIHSLRWAAEIVAQDNPFCNLPYEVRLEIYEAVMADFTGEETREASEEMRDRFWDDFWFGQNRIGPLKNGKKFFSPGWCNSDADTSRLLLICRQTYVEVAGGALLYKFNSFCFRSTYLMLNYLFVIKPFHMNSIRSIELLQTLSVQKKTLDAKAFAALAQCQGLQNLTVNIHNNGDLLMYRQSWSMIQQSYIGYYGLPKHVINGVKDFKPLRALRGLSSFNLVFVFSDRAIPSGYSIESGFQRQFRLTREAIRQAIVKDYKPQPQSIYQDHDELTFSMS